MAAPSKKQTGPVAQACIISAGSYEDSLSAAKIRAAAAVCTKGGDKPCGICRSCRKAAAGNHPDIMTVSRLTDDKGREKREIGVEQIRSVRADACVLPNEAARKVYIINEADTMNISAQNAALKLLEEPPNGALFLLCVKNTELLLPTIRSRCTMINVSSGSSEKDGEEEKLALEYIKAAASGQRIKILRWCSQNEGMDTRAASAFTDAAFRVLGDMLCGRRNNMGLQLRELMRLSGLISQCSEYLKVNVGVKHIFGLLAVDSIVNTRKEELN